MDDPFDENIDKSETFEDVYHLAVEINDSNLKKLRQDLQQIRYEIAETQASVNRLRTDPGSNDEQIKQSMRTLAELKKTQTSIVNNINSSIVNQAGTVDRMTNALAALNAEMHSGNLNAQNLSSFVSIIEGSIARMASVSKKSEDYKKLQSSLGNVGIDVSVEGVKRGSADISKLKEEVDNINNTPVTITVDGQHTIQTVASQLNWIIHLSRQLSAELNKNITLLTSMEGKQKSTIITPSAYQGRLNIEGKPLQRIGSVFDITPNAQPVSSNQTGIPPNEVVRAAYFGAPYFWRGANQQVITSRNPMAPRGTAQADIRDRMASIGLTGQAPAMRNFGAFENSTFLNTSDVNLINKHFQEFLQPIDPTILSGIRTLESRFNRGEQIKRRAQLGEIVKNITNDRLASAMDKAYYYQLAKMVALYQQDLEDRSPAAYATRGKPSVDLNDQQLAMLNLIDQFGGTLQTSEISRALGTGHYQGVASDIRVLLSKGLVRRGIIPPFPIPEAGVPNQIAPQILAANMVAPNVGLDAAMATTMIKPLEATELGKKVLAMTGMSGLPGNVSADMYLNKLVDKIEPILVENQNVRFGINTPTQPQWWLKGPETAVYGEGPLGDRILHYMDKFLNNIDAIKPEYAAPFLPFIPYTEDKTGRKTIDVEALRSGRYNLEDTSTAKYLNARSDIYTMMQTPHVPIDKIMEMWATPHREVFTEDLKGSDLFRQTVLNWASGPTGLGVNPQLARYTVTPEQATQHLNTLWSGMATDKFLSKESDSYRAIYNKDYNNFTHYERSIIVRAMQQMLTRAIPVTSGFDVATNEEFRPRSYMTKAETRGMRDSLNAIREAEISNLLTAVPDLGKIIKAIEQHNADILKFDVVDTGYTPTAPTPAYRLTDAQKMRIENMRDVPTSWKNYAPFFAATPGMTYEETYAIGGASNFRDIGNDPNAFASSIAAINTSSYSKQLGTSRLPADVMRFKREVSERSPIIGFSGRLPWNEILKYHASMGSRELKTPEAQAEFERLISNPQELMKELFWDEDEMIKSTYGTMAVKTPLFEKSIDLSPAASADLYKRTQDYRPEDAFNKVEDLRTKLDQFKGTIYEKTIRKHLDAAQQQLTDLETLYNTEILDWMSEWNIDQENEDYFINPYKLTKRGTVSKFFTYTPATVPKEKVLARMDYERQHGLMDPELLESYAKSIANFNTSKNTPRSHRQGIEAMYLGTDWSREAMPELGAIAESKLLHGFLRYGAEGKFDINNQDTWDTNDFSVQEIMSASGIDTAMLTDEDISKYLQEDPEFRDTVREALMENQDLNSSQYDIIKTNLEQELRQQIKAYGRSSGKVLAIEDYASSVLNAAQSHETPEGQYPLGERDIFAEKPEELSSNLSGGFALLDVLKQVAWGNNPNKQSKDSMHKALVAWRKKEEERMFRDFYPSNLSTNPAGYVGELSNMLPINLENFPDVELDKSITSGQYSLLQNKMFLSPNANEDVIRHELMHPAAYEKMFGQGKFGSIKEFYTSRGLNLLPHSASQGLAAANLNQKSPYSSKFSQYFDQLSKSATDEEYQNEMRRLNPAYTFYKNASPTDVGLATSYGEEIAQLMSTFDANLPTHLQNLSALRTSKGQSGTISDEDLAKINFFRDMFGSGTSMPAMPSATSTMFAASISPMLAGGPSYRNVRRNMMGSQGLLSPVERMLLPMSSTEQLVNEFNKRYTNRMQGPERMKLLTGDIIPPEGYTYLPGAASMMRETPGPFGASGSYRYLGNMGGIAVGSPADVIAQSLGAGGVTYPGTAKAQSYNAEQVKAWSQRVNSMVALPPPSGPTEPKFTMNAAPLDIEGLMGEMNPAVRTGWDKLNESVIGRVYARAKGFIGKVSAKHTENIAAAVGRMPDVSMADPNRMVTSRGTELPLSYVLKSTFFGHGAEGEEKMRAEVDRFYTSLQDQGVDTSKIKHDIIRQSGFRVDDNGQIVREKYTQAQIFGKARIPDTLFGGSEKRAADFLKGEMTLGFASVNEQGMRFEDTMKRMPGLLERFSGYGKNIGDMSWKFTTLQMASLGIFFSMMSIVSVMGQGIGLVLGGMGDLEGMMKAGAFAGMGMPDEYKNKLSGQAIDARLGISATDRETGWERYTGFVSSLSYMLSGFGTKLMLNDEFYESMLNFAERLMRVLENPKNLETVVHLGETLFDTLGNVAEALPGVITAFDKIASYKVPGTQTSMLTVASVAALGAMIAMPILAGLTLLTKIGGGVGMLAGGIDRIASWNLRREAIKQMMNEGASRQFAKWAVNDKGVIGGTKGISDADLKFAEKMGYYNPGGNVADDVAKSGSKLGKALDDIAERISSIKEKFPAGTKAAEGSILGAEAAARTARNTAKGEGSWRVSDKGWRWVSAAELAADEEKRVAAAMKEADELRASGWTDAADEIERKEAMRAAQASKVVDTGGSKWKWVKGTVAANAIGMIPFATEMAFPQTAPIMEPANAALAFSPAISSATGLGAGAAGAAAGPLGVIATAPPVGGPDMSVIGGRNIEKVRQPWMGILDLPGLTTNEYYDTTTGEMLPDITDTMWEQSKKQANGLAEEPLNSKWSKQSSSTFNQTNYITMPATNERMDSMDAKLNAIMRMLGL